MCRLKVCMEPRYETGDPYLLVHRLTEQLEDLEGQLASPSEKSGSHEE